MFFASAHVALTTNGQRSSRLFVPGHISYVLTNKSGGGLLSTNALQAVRVNWPSDSAARQSQAG
jgi:hypothetical protein